MAAATTMIGGLRVHRLYLRNKLPRIRVPSTGVNLQKYVMSMQVLNSTKVLPDGLGLEPLVEVTCRWGEWEVGFELLEPLSRCDGVGDASACQPLASSMGVACVDWTFHMLR